MIETIKNVFSTLTEFLHQVKALGIPKTFDEAYAFVKAVFFDIIGSMGTIYILTFAVCAAIFAFAGFRLYKLALYAGGSVAIAYGVRYFSDKILPLVEGKVPENIDVIAILMVVAAVIAIIITRFRRKFMVSLMGALAGYIVGTKFVADLIIAQFPTLNFLKHNIFYTVVGVLCGIVLLLVFRLVFEHAFVICSGVGGMACCGLLVGLAVMPDAGKTDLLIFIAAGVVAGILAVIHQYNQEAKNNDVFYSYKL